MAHGEPALLTAALLDIARRLPRALAPVAANDGIEDELCTYVKDVCVGACVGVGVREWMCESVWMCECVWMWGCVDVQMCG